MTKVVRIARMSVCLLLLFGASGCDIFDFFVFTDEGLVKNRIREQCEAITAKDWRKAAALYDTRFQWQQGNTVLKGKAGIKAFWKSIENIVNCDEFMAVVHEVKKTGPQKIVARVTFQAHVIESSMTMRYSNVTWEASMLWVKRGNADWRIIYIKELSARKKGKFSRVKV